MSLADFHWPFLVALVAATGLCLYLTLFGRGYGGMVDQYGRPFPPEEEDDDDGRH